MECVDQRIKANAIQLRLRAGPHYQKYRASLAEAHGLVPLDASPRST